uniref:Uncharacterized protein n=1 Tax=Anguilla anguilla TaxID=7936 RepID=A0A0E9WWV0_ANGAN
MSRRISSPRLFTFTLKMQICHSNRDFALKRLYCHACEFSHEVLTCLSCLVHLLF